MPKHDIPPPPPSSDDSDDDEDQVFTEPTPKFESRKVHKSKKDDKDKEKISHSSGHSHSSAHSSGHSSHSRGHSSHSRGHSSHSHHAHPKSTKKSKEKKPHEHTKDTSPPPPLHEEEEEEEERHGGGLKRTLSREDLKKKFELTNPSPGQKKKVQRQTANLYQAAHEFKKDFKPPKFPKTDEEKDLIKKALRKNFVFSDLTSKELRPLVCAFEICSFETDETIIKQGDRGDYFYIIRKGKVTFRVNGVDVGKAGKGSSFGELALLYTCPRAATVVATERTKVFRVGQATFQFILQSQTAESAMEKIDLLKGVKFLKGLDKHDLKELTKVMTPKIFEEGDFLVKKGEPGDAFYVIQEGQVVIKDISVGGTKYEDLELGPGGHFGERALVTSEPRAANVVGKTSGVAFSIDRVTFEKVLGGMEDLVMKAEDARLLAGITLFKTRLSEDTFARLAELILDNSYAKEHIIMKEGHRTPAALYVIREGTVVIKNRKESRSKETLSVGEFFGEDTLFTGSKTSKSRIEAPYSVVASTNCRIGVLSLSDCHYVFDPKVALGMKKRPSYTMTKKELEALPPAPESNIKLEDLEKKTILGEGSFGQVWLVSAPDEDTGESTPYALKIQSKWDLYDEGQITAVIREKQLLSEIDHPFVVNLVATYQDPTFVYFLTEFVQGGELYSLMFKDEESALTESQAKFYAFAIADALAHLHALKIVYRDIKPENVLIDTSGFPKLIDFGFARYCPEKTFTFCGTPGYLCPEIITKRGHDCSADNWSLGILIYEMLSGENPFYFEGMDQMTLFRCIVEDDFLPLTGVSDEAHDIALKLLVKDPSMRLGASRRRGFVMEHDWFSDMDVEAMRHRKLEPPWKPGIADPFDPVNFEDFDDLEDKSKENFEEIPEEEEMRFQEEF